MARAKRGPVSETSRKKYRGGLRWLLLGLASIAVLVIAAHALLHTLVDAGSLERRLTEALAASSDSLYRVEIKDVAFSLLSGSLVAENVVLQPDPEVLHRRSEAGELPSSCYRLTLPVLRLEGVNLWRLLWKQDIKLRALRLQSPHLYIETGCARDQAASEEDEEQAPADSFHVMVARGLPPIYAEHLYVEHGFVSLERAGGEKSETIEGLSMQLHDVVIDPTSARDTSRVLFSDEVQIQVQPQRRFSSDSLYIFETGALQGSSKAASLRVASMRWEPTVSDKAFMQRHAYRTNRYKVATGPIALTGVDYRRLIEQGEIAVGLLHVDSLLIDIYYDRTLPEPPKPPSPKLPHEAFQEIDRPLRLDTIRVTHGVVRYSERSVDGARPGTITFADTWGTIYNVTNDPRRMTSARPAVLEGRTLLAGAGRLQATIRYWLLAPSLSMTYRGTLGRMDARALNRMLVDLEGIRIKRGRIDSLWFDVRVDQDVASGALQAIYRDLRIETLDKVTRERRLKHRIETLIANETRIKSENVAEGDDPARVALIRHTREAEDPLIEFVWESLREGLFKTIGL